LASHQLRTPLSAIKWYTGILRKQIRDRLTQKQADYLDKVFEANERMIRLVNMLLNVSRIEIGSITVEPGDVSVSEMVDGIVDQLSPDVEKKQLRIDSDLKGKLTVYTDSNILHIVLQNLISNAIKYTPELGSIHVGAMREGDKVKIDISDTGCGIPQDEHDKIFSKMYRASNARQLSVQGTGLGLYIAKAAVEAIGGSISFTSEEGKGTTFTIFLPLVLESASESGKKLIAANPVS